MGKFSWSIDHPILSFPDPSHQEFKIKIPTTIRWSTLFDEVKLRLDLDTLSGLLDSLRRYIKYLFRNRVEYHLNPERIFPFKAKSREAVRILTGACSWGIRGRLSFIRTFPRATRKSGNGEKRSSSMRLNAFLRRRDSCVSNSLP